MTEYETIKPLRKIGFKVSNQDAARFEASGPKRRLEFLAFSHITGRKQRTFLDAKRPAEAGLSISNGAGERT